MVFTINKPDNIFINNYICLKEFSKFFYNKNKNKNNELKKSVLFINNQLLNNILYQTIMMSGK